MHFLQWFLASLPTTGTLLPKPVTSGTVEKDRVRFRSPR